MGSLVWGIERQVKRALARVTVPRECPAGKLFVPRSVRPAVLRWSHASKLVAHPGIRGTLTTVRQRFWWPALAHDVHRFVISCPVCARACERSWAVRIPAPRSRGCSLPPLHCSKSHQNAPLNPAHLQFHPTPVKSLHARSNLKFLCMPNTCHFQPKPYAWDTLSVWRTWSGFVAWLLRKKSASLLFCRGAAVAVWLDRAPDTRIFRRQCGCSNLLT